MLRLLVWGRAREPVYAMLEISFAGLSCAGAVASCFGLASIFVLSLYAVDTGLSRNHPNTVRRRVAVILLVCLGAPLYVWAWSDGGGAGQPLPLVLGLRTRGLLQAATLPLLLVLVLFLGPLLQTLTSGESLLDPITSERVDLVLRNYLIAPFAEEFIFRACMVPLLLPHLGEMLTVFLCPLYFGLAHTHHLVEWLRQGKGSFFVACASVLVQFTYTSIYGMFSAFLFIRTGHLASPVLTHALCNVLGLPPFEHVPQHRHPVWISIAYVAGLIGFIALLSPLTSPALYQ